MTTGLPTPTTEAGRRALDALVREPERALLAFDFDGTLSPIVDDPLQSRPHPGVLPVFRSLAARVGGLAIVTGRPVELVLRLGGFASAGLAGRLLVYGLYGLERWDSSVGQLSAPPVHPGVHRVRAALPAVLAAAGAPEGTWVEDKGRSVAVHLRRAAHPDAATALLTTPLTELAHREGLTVETGRRVLELRPSDIDKGAALREVADTLDVRTVVFGGDDLGDLAAFDAVETMRSGGGRAAGADSAPPGGSDARDGLLVCAGSSEAEVVAERADLVVDGPAGMVAFLEAVAAQLPLPGR